MDDTETRRVDRCFTPGSYVRSRTAGSNERLLDALATGESRPDAEELEYLRAGLSWRAALHPFVTPDAPQALVPYGAAFRPTELPDIPHDDLAAGSPAWMCGNADWARRTGKDDKTKRVTITVMVPKAFRP